MKLLILGYSDFVKRRILPILVSDFKKIKIAIASKTQRFDFKSKEIIFFRDYLKSIKEFKPDIVYISLPNSLHYKWAKEALLRNINVIVDKPITLKLKQANDLIKLSRANKKLLAEATIFSFHNQIKKAVKLVGGLKNIDQIVMNFCIPFPPKNNIKLSHKLGGGVNNDMGPYAASTFRIFYKYFPEKIYKITNIQKKVITKLSLIASYKSKHLIGHLAFGKEYKNDLLLFSNKKIVKINSVFSPNPFLSTEILTKFKNQFKKKIIEKQSTFKTFLNLYLKCLKVKKYNFFYENIIYDSKFREKLNEKK